MKIAVLIPSLAVSLLLARADDKVDFAKSIQPVLESRCIECHGVLVKWVVDEVDGVRLDVYY